ncbi:MAG: DNA methyltransferase, partial [Phycisphaerae bacterium]
DRREDRPSMYFAVQAPDGSNIFPISPDGYESRWRCGASRYASLVQQKMIEWKRIGEDKEARWQPYQKFYLAGRLRQPSNLWYDIEGNKKASIDVKTLFDEKVFDFPKPVELIERCISICAEPDSIILDYFSGSCTTAHAVLDLNKQDSGTRKFIMVQLPEPCDKESEAFKAGYKNIAEIGKERIRRVIEKLNDEDAAATAKEQQAPALFSSGGRASCPTQAGQDARSPDRGFKVFKLDSSNIKTWDPNFNQLEHTLLNATEKMKPDRTEADVIYEVLLKYGLDLTLPIEKRTIADRTVYIIGGGTLVVCLGMNMTLKIVETIAELKDEFQPETPPGMRMVFKDNGFANDELKTNAVQILKQRGIVDVRAL